MSPDLLVRSSRGLRLRMTVLLMAGLLFAGVGFEVLLVSVVRHSEYQELESRARSLARLMAERSVTPVVVGDRVELGRQVHRAITEPDVLGAGVYSERGRALAQRSRVAELWPGLGPLRGRVEPRTVVVVRRRVQDGEVLDAVIPVMRPAGRAGTLGEASQLFGFADLGRAPAESHLGWVRLVISTDRAREAAGTAGRLGLLLLLATLILGLFGVSLYVGVIVRPLREAGDLAREIASGQLDRRLPVRSADELGDLAGSMNTMAAALKEARGAAEAEAEALRTASAAVLSIARGARAAHDLPSIFGMVASEVRRVTHCRAVALALAGPQQTIPSFEHFDPPPPWGGLDEGTPAA